MITKRQKNKNPQPLQKSVIQKLKKKKVLLDKLFC